MRRLDGQRSRVAAVDLGQLVGARIRALRKGRKLTIEALAGRAEIDTSYLSNIERGVQNPSLAMLSQIADALEVALPEIVDVGPHEDEIALRQRVATRLERMSREQLRALLRWLDAFVGG